ncbi:hypothetical protein CEXT_703611 [Caerostris extrusa]|uniref:Uncharacterized protein n=1 Tax=Caerostris extrusa TaxID=172846 RepID=A0AAV4MXQ6_CAEEX|nr:hypothetical protein CEXT_703611 [Caerostris extrusa]
MLILTTYRTYRLATNFSIQALIDTVSGDNRASQPESSLQSKRHPRRVRGDIRGGKEGSTVRRRDEFQNLSMTGMRRISSVLPTHAQLNIRVVVGWGSSELR